MIANPDGTFQPRVDYPTGAEPLAIAVGDFNGDRNLDLAVADWGRYGVMLFDVIPAELESAHSHKEHFDRFSRCKSARISAAL